MAGRMHAAAVAARTERIVHRVLDDEGEDAFRPVSKVQREGMSIKGVSVKKSGKCSKGGGVSRSAGRTRFMLSTANDVTAARRSKKIGNFT